MNDRQSLSLEKSAPWEGKRFVVDFFTFMVVLLALLNQSPGAEPLCFVANEDKLRAATDSRLALSRDESRLLVTRDREFKTYIYRLDRAAGTATETGQIKLPKGAPPSDAAWLGPDKAVVLDMDSASAAIFQSIDTAEPRFLCAAGWTTRDMIVQPRSVAVNKDASIAYFTAAATDQLWVLGLDPKTLPFLQCVTTAPAGAPGVPTSVATIAVPELKFPWAVAISGDGKDLYVVCFQSMALVHFRIGDNGKLSPIGPPHAFHNDLGFARALAISPDGKSVYAGGAGNAVIAFHRNLDSGALGYAQLLTNHDQGLADLLYVKSLRVSPDGKFVCAACSQSGAVVLFDRGPDGALTLRRVIQNTDFTKPVLGGVSDAIVTSAGGHIIVTSSDARVAVLSLE